jgi:light-regulated signal transduction histidine kinase (bacteriophytochrome)
MPMAKKPTYEELEQGVMKLEEQAFEHNKAKEELQHRIAELQRNNQELKHFVDVALNNLQEPLDKVLSYLQFVEARYKGRLGPDADDFITSAMEGAKRIQSVVSKMSAYLRNNQGGGVVSGAISD